MKILMIATEFSPIIGGGGRYVENLVTELSKQGIEVRLLTSGELDEEISISKNLTIKRCKLLNDLYFGKGNFMEGVNQIIKEIETEMPDVIHTHHSLESLMVQAANINYSIPHIITHHKTPEYREEKYKLNGKWSVFKFTNKIDDKDLFIAPSMAFVSSLIDSGVEENKIFQIYPGVDQSIYKKINNSKTLVDMKTRLNIGKNDILILLPTQVRQRKGVEFALKTLAKLRIESKNIKVLITGLPFLSAEKQKELSEILLPNQIIKVEKVFKDEEMPILYNISDLVLLTSEAEGLGMCLLEAMACQTPIIGTDVMGINEVITDGFNGGLVKFGDQKSLKEKIIGLLFNKPLKEKYIKNSLSLLKEKFNLTNQAVKHTEIYEKCSSQKPYKQNITLKISDIKNILNLTKTYKDLIDNNSTVAFLLIGSIPENKYIPGWSDIDLICLADNPDLEFFTRIASLEQEINSFTGVKTGIEVVDYKNLTKATIHPVLAENFVKYIKNFYEKVDKAKVLFLKNGNVLPFFDDNVVSKISLTVHTLQTVNYMNKYLKTTSKEKQKEVIRKIIKNILFVMQSYLLIKHNLFVEDYELVIKEYSIYNPKLDYGIIDQYFKNRHSWNAIRDKEISDQDISACWNLFQKVVTKSLSI